MEDFRSKSCCHGRTQMECYNGGSGSAVNEMQDLRCCTPPTRPQCTSSSSKPRRETTARSSGRGSRSDPELLRKKRVASYKVYAVEGKLKGSLRQSFRWLKGACNRVVYSP